MHLLNRREHFDDRSTTGELYLDPTDTQRFCYTLEPPEKTDGTKPRAIPAGTYPLTLEMSEHFGRPVPHVNDVPGFTAVEIHWGNFPKDTDACLVVGESEAIDFVGNSRDAFDALWQKLTTNEGPHFITYIDVKPDDTVVCDPEDMA